MKTTKFLKALAIVCTLCIVFSFVACSDNNQNDLNEESIENYEIVDGVIKPNSVVEPKPVNKKHITPDLDSVVLKEASTKVIDTSTEEDFVYALECFTNPNGNEYDALSILGSFRYTEEGEALFARLKGASENWHQVIKENVGEKCTVGIKLKSKNPLSLSDSKVADWNTVNGKKAQAYSNIKCVISTNYAADALTLSFDIVKINGKWHLANTGTLNKLQAVITKDIYK